MNAVKVIAAEVAGAAAQVSDAQIAQAAELITRANRVFLAGMGRSGFTSRAFANRLGHLGVAASFVGEPTTPPIGAGDLLVVTSGSGETETLVQFGHKADAAGAEVLLLTSAGSSSRLREMAAASVDIPGISRLSRTDAAPTESQQPVGSLFEQLAWLVCDAIVMTIRDATGQSNQDLIARHGNLE